MTALTRSARHLAALLSDSNATPERTPEEAKRAQEERALAEVVMGHRSRMRFKVASWTIDRDGVVCLRSEGGGIMFVNRRVFDPNHRSSVPNFGCFIKAEINGKLKHFAPSSPSALISAPSATSSSAIAHGSRPRHGQRGRSCGR